MYPGDAYRADPGGGDSTVRVSTIPAASTAVRLRGMLWRLCAVFVAAVIWQAFALHGHPWMFGYPAAMFLLALSTWLRRRRAVTSHDETTQPHAWGQRPGYRQQEGGVQTGHPPFSVAPSIAPQRCSVLSRDG
jgi:hypothetical protein